MYRRLYVTLPCAAHALGLVAELENAGVDRVRVRATAKGGVDQSGLPEANEAEHGSNLAHGAQVLVRQPGAAHPRRYRASSRLVGLVPVRDRDLTCRHAL